MEFIDDPRSQILLPEKCWQIILEHCRRKMAGLYTSGETEDRKAFGLLAGSISGRTIKVERCLPLLKNARGREPFKEFMDRIMTRHAVPSESPPAKRGWVADPEELSAGIKVCQADGLRLLGTYHLHRVAWDHDPVRDTPTELDTVLAADSRIFMFIISMVDPARPLVRAFFEGLPAREVRVLIDKGGSLD